MNYILMLFADKWSWGSVCGVSILSTVGQFVPCGTHCCFVSHFARPSLSSLLECPGRVAGSKRLRGLLARKTVKQVVDLADFLHGVGIVHGGSFSNYMSLLC